MFYAGVFVTKKGTCIVYFSGIVAFRLYFIEHRAKWKSTYYILVLLR